MNQDLQSYRFARIDAYNIARARLAEHFKEGITDIEAFEATIAHELAMRPADCAPWCTSQVEKMGFLDGVRLAALEFYWTKRRVNPICSLHPA
jgi:hypothetical protein